MFAKISDGEKGHEIFFLHFIFISKREKIEFSVFYFSTKLEAKISTRAKKRNFIEFIFLPNWKQKSVLEQKKKFS